MNILPTNFQDAEYEGLRKYRMINNDDGTVSFQDVTNYIKVGSTFGAEQINNINRNINEIVPYSPKSAEETNFIKLATLTMTGNYVDSPITMELSKRNHKMTSKIFIQFQPTSSADPDLKSFLYTYENYEAYMYKEKAGIWGLYLTYPRYESITVMSFNIPKSDAIKITWDGTFVDSIPSGAILCTKAQY